MTCNGVFRSAGDDLAFMQLAAALAQDKDLFILVKNVGVLAPFGSQYHLHARPHLPLIAFRLPHRFLVLPRNRFSFWPLRGAAVTIFTSDLRLKVHVFICIPVAHDVP